MERLTQETVKGASLIISVNQSESSAKAELMQKFRQAVDRLAAYERTGLAPEEIEKLRQFLGSYVLRENGVADITPSGAGSEKT